MNVKQENILFQKWALCTWMLIHYAILVYLKVPGINKKCWKNKWIKHFHENVIIDVLLEFKNYHKIRDKER